MLLNKNLKTEVLSIMGALSLTVFGAGCKAAGDSTEPIVVSSTPEAALDEKTSDDCYDSVLKISLPDNFLTDLAPISDQIDVFVFAATQSDVDNFDVVDRKDGDFSEIRKAAGLYLEKLQSKDFQTLSASVSEGQLTIDLSSLGKGEHWTIIHIDYFDMYNKQRSFYAFPGLSESSADILESLIKSTGDDKKVSGGSVIALDVLSAFGSKFADDYQILNIDSNGCLERDLSKSTTDAIQINDLSNRFGNLSSDLFAKEDSAQDKDPNDDPSPDPSPEPSYTPSPSGVGELRLKSDSLQAKNGADSGCHEVKFGVYDTGNEELLSYNKTTVFDISGTLMGQSLSFLTSCDGGQALSQVTLTTEIPEVAFAVQIPEPSVRLDPGIIIQADTPNDDPWMLYAGLSSAIYLDLYSETLSYSTVNSGSCHLVDLELYNKSEAISLNGSLTLPVSASMLVYKSSKAEVQSNVEVKASCDPQAGTITSVTFTQQALSTTVGVWVPSVEADENDPVGSATLSILVSRPDQSEVIRKTEGNIQLIQ